MNNFNFNSLTEVTNAVANYINQDFILIVDNCGEYTPKTWNYIEVDSGVSNPASILTKLPEDLISSIQAWEQDECIAKLIFISLTRTSLSKPYKELYKILWDIAQTEDKGLGDDDYFDYIPNAFDILGRILFGLAHTYEDPNCAFDILRFHLNHYDLLKAYAKFSNDLYNSDNILSLISPQAYSEILSFKEGVQIHKL